MSKSKIGRIYTSKTVQKILKKYITEDQKRIDRRMQQAARIKAALDTRGMTPKELATRVGKRPSEIKRLLGGDQDFSADLIAKIQAVLGLTD